MNSFLVKIKPTSLDYSILNQDTILIINISGSNSITINDGSDQPLGYERNKKLFYYRVGQLS